MATQYYYIVSSLPELSPEDKNVPFSSLELYQEIRELLAPNDQKWFDYLYLPIDNRNLLSLVKGQEEDFNPAGTISLEDLQTGLAMPEQLPEYMGTFIEENRSAFESSSYKELEFSLLQAFTNWKLALPHTFLREWFTFEANLNNMLAALNAREFEMDLESQVVGDYSEAEQIRTSRDRDFRLTGILDYAESVMTLYSHPNLMVRENEILRLKWRMIEELAQSEYFSIDQILSFTLKLMLQERSTRLTDDKGQSRLDAVLADIKKNFTIPDKFALSHT